VTELLNSQPLYLRGDGVFPSGSRAAVPVMITVPKSWAAEITHVGLFLGARNISQSTPADSDVAFRPAWWTNTNAPAYANVGNPGDCSGTVFIEDEVGVGDAAVKTPWSSAPVDVAAFASAPVGGPFPLASAPLITAWQGPRRLPVPRRLAAGAILRVTFYPSTSRAQEADVVTQFRVRVLCKGRRLTR